MLCPHLSHRRALWRAKVLNENIWSLLPLVPVMRPTMRLLSGGWLTDRAPLHPLLVRG